MGMCKTRVAGCKVRSEPQLDTPQDGLKPLLPGLPGEDVNVSRFFELVPLAMPGLAKSASRIEEAFSSGEASACAIAISLDTSGTGLERWPGMRDEIAAGHPAAVTLSKAAEDERYPDPCDDTVRALSSVAGFRMEGKVCSIDGVTVPAGRPQLIFLTYNRWRSLFNPMSKAHEIYAGDSVYDRVMSTDHIQRQLWGFGVYDFVGYLEAILSESPELFVAIWLRRWDEIDRLLTQAEAQDEPSPCELFDTPVLLTLTTGKRDSFLAPWAIMSEIERIVEIANQMKARKGVSAAAVRKRLAAYRTIDELMADESEIGKHIQGLLFSLRFVHHTMNGSSQAYTDTDLLVRLKHSVECSDPLRESFRRVECPGGAAPALFMNGLDLAHFLPASLYQLALGLSELVDRAKRPEGLLKNVLKRVRRGLWLSIVMLANICPPTAQTLTAKFNRAPPQKREEGEKVDYVRVRRNEPGWLAIYPTAMALGSKAFAVDRPGSHELEKFVKNKFGPHFQRIDDIVAALPEAFKNLKGKIVNSALDSASRFGNPGWTRGAYHQAWLQPDAEVAFLGRCSNFILYDAKLDMAAKSFKHSIVASKSVTAKKRVPHKRSLPLSHPVEHIQQIFRRQFDLLQIPDVIPDEETQRRAFRKFAILQQAARRLPAWSPLNSDPALAERIGSLPVGKVGGSGSAWALSENEISFSRDWSWHRDWKSCGRI